MCWSGKMSDDSSEDCASVSSAPRHFKSKLEEALTAKQEFEAKVSTLDEKVKQYEAEIADLRLRVRCFHCFHSIHLGLTGTYYVGGIKQCCDSSVHPTLLFSDSVPFARWWYAHISISHISIGGSTVGYASIQMLSVGAHCFAVRCHVCLGLFVYFVVAWHCASYWTVIVTNWSIIKTAVNIIA